MMVATNPLYRSYTEESDNILTRKLCREIPDDLGKIAVSGFCLSDRIGKASLTPMDSGLGVVVDVVDVVFNEVEK
jgi:hypothetical protein